MKSWYGCSLPDTSTLADAYVDFSSGNLDHDLPIPDEYRNVSIVANAGSHRNDMIRVNSSCQIGEVASTLGQFVEFVVSKQIDNSLIQCSSMDATPTPRVDAFALMMQSSRMTCCLPEKWVIVSPNKHGVPALFEIFEVYNKPEKSKKKKIDHTKLKATELLAHSSSLFTLAGQSYMNGQKWIPVREAILRLADNLRKHATYLNHQNEAVQSNHSKKVCVRSDVDEFKVLSITHCIKPARYWSLHESLNHVSEYEPILVEEHSPSAAKRRYSYYNELVVPYKCVLYTYSGSRFFLHFLWKIPNDLSETELLQRNMVIQQELKKIFQDTIHVQ